MTPLPYDEDWIPPWRQSEQARCQGQGCTSDGAHPGKFVIASTLDEAGRCASCGRLADDDHTRLRTEA